jgi:hypothetical protein
MMLDAMREKGALMKGNDPLIDHGSQGLTKKGDRILHFE